MRLLKDMRLLSKVRLLTRVYGIISFNLVEAIKVHVLDPKVTKLEYLTFQFSPDSTLLLCNTM